MPRLVKVTGNLPCDLLVLRRCCCLLLFCCCCCCGCCCQGWSMLSLEVVSLVLASEHRGWAVDDSEEPRCSTTYGNMFFLVKLCASTFGDNLGPKWVPWLQHDLNTAIRKRSSKYLTACFSCSRVVARSLQGIVIDVWWWWCEHLNSTEDRCKEMMNWRFKIFFCCEIELIQYVLWWYRFCVSRKVLNGWVWLSISRRNSELLLKWFCEEKLYNDGVLEGHGQGRFVGGVDDTRKRLISCCYNLIIVGFVSECKSISAKNLQFTGFRT